MGEVNNTSSNLHTFLSFLFKGYIHKNMFEHLAVDNHVWLQY